MHLDVLVRLQLVNPQQRMQVCEHLPALLLGSFLGSSTARENSPDSFVSPARPLFMFILGKEE